MTGWIVVWVLGVLAVAAAFANHRYHLVAGWWYSWAHAAHVIEQGPVPAPECGSMILAEERRLRGPGASTTLLPAPPELAHEPDWREQTAADLAPETLAEEGNLWPGLALMTAGLIVADAMDHLDSGEVMPDASAIAMHMPGVQGSTAPVSPGPGAALSSLTAPGPDPAAEADGWVMPVIIPSDIFKPTRLADTGDIASAHLLADVQAFMRAQDADAVAHVAGLRADLTAALA